MNKVLFISVKPEFAEKIINGSKTVELRKCSPDAGVGDLVIIYSTLPEKAVVGTGVVRSIVKSTPYQLWQDHSRHMGIDRKRYFEYYKDCEVAIGIFLTSIDKLEKKITLASIRKAIPNFSPPQTFKYLSQSQFKKFIAA